MALLTDGTICNIDDLTAHDAAVLDVASTEGIDLTKKLILAQERVSLELTNLLPGGDGLVSVVVTTVLRLWHAYHALELVYRDAYGNQLNERYAGKRDQYAALAKWAAEKILENGIGMAGIPVARADVPELSYCAGNLAAASYYASLAWVNRIGQEGAASDWRTIAAPDFNILCVRPPRPPVGAAGWNVFVGLTPEAMSQQNTGALGLTEAWLQQAPVTLDGRLPGTGQAPDYTRQVARILQRG